MEQKKLTLWTKNFTIITLGTLCSMCGVTVLSFSSGLLIYDETGSTFLFSLFLVLMNLPSVISPLFVGPYLDRFSRRRLIYTFDFISGLLCLFACAVVYFKLFPAWVYYIFGGVFGAIGGAYNTTYDSFYPSLITKGMETKAYSVSSLLYPLANTLLLPIAAIVYESVGIPILFLFTAIMYIIAAIFEMQIKCDESYLLERKVSQYKAKQYIEDFKEGIRFIKNDKGLLSITFLFFFIFFADGTYSALLLPFFKSTAGYSVQQYSYIQAICTMGRFLGGLIIYKRAYKRDKRFFIACAVYITIAIIQGVFFFSPFYIMLALAFLLGLFSVTSYNIRISSTQSYLKEEVRGRFNGSFLMIATLGQILGQLGSGILAEFFPTKYIVMFAYILDVIIIITFFIPRGKYVKKIYNV